MTADQLRAVEACDHRGDHRCPACASPCDPDEEPVPRVAGFSTRLREEDVSPLL